MTLIVYHFRRFLQKLVDRRAQQAMETDHKDTFEISEINLSAGRLALASGSFEDAYAAYTAASAQDKKNLECFIGIALCHFHRGLTSDALAVLIEARSHFGNHDAILGVLVKCHMRLLNWQALESTWREWADALGEHPTDDFFHTSGEVLTALIKSELLPIFSNDILACLLYQPDATVDAESHPVICSLLFHHHEYDRPVYNKFMDVLLHFQELYGIEPERNMSVATVALSFGLADSEQRYRLIEKFFSDFCLYSHWTFVLLSSAWNDVWDTSLASQANLRITSEILESRIETIDEWPADLLFKAFILADICCRHTIPRLLLHTRLRLQIDEKLDDYREDLSRISRNSSSELSTPIPVISSDRPLRIAVCISGQLRGYRQAFPTWHFLGLGEHQVTYIVHTWEDVGGGYPIPPKDARLLSRTLLEPFRAAWNEHGQDEMFSRYQTFFGLWSKENAHAELEDLKTFYGTKFVTVEDDSEEKFQFFSNAQKMYYKIERCHEAAKSLGVEFDLMIRIRPDWIFQKQCEIDWRKLFQCANSKKTIFVEHYATYLFPHIGYCMGDQFAIATPIAMDGYAAAYRLTLERLNGTGPRHFPSNFMAHRNVAFANLFSGLTVNPVSISVQLAPMHRPSSAAILAAIQATACDDETHRRLVLAAALDAGVAA